MAKYCIKCGKELKGKTCNCESKKEKEIKEGLDEIIEIKETLLNVVKGMFTKPIDTMKSFIKDENMTIGFILLGIQVFVVALLMLIGAKELYGSLFSGYSYLSLSVEIPYARIFFSTLFGGAISVLAFAGLLYLVSTKLFAGKTTFGKIVSHLGVISIFITLAALASMILLFVLTELMLMVIIAGLMLHVCYLFLGLPSSIEMDENKYGYTVLISGIVFIIIGMIFM